MHQKGFSNKKRIGDWDESSRCPGYKRRLGVTLGGTGGLDFEAS